MKDQTKPPIILYDMEEIRATTSGQCYIAPNGDVEKKRNDVKLLSYSKRGLQLTSVYSIRISWP